MPRSTDPGASFETATRHLFRHLHDPAALRRNPLAALVLAESTSKDVLIDTILRLADAVSQERVAGRLRRNAERQRNVFIRAVIYREPWAKIASDLWLSRRQFTRDKTTFCRRVGARLTRQADVLATYSTVSAVDADAAIFAAHVQADGGLLLGAISQLTNIARSAPDWQSRFEALCASARILNEYSDQSSALAAVREARAFLMSGDERDQGLLATAGARLDIVEALIARGTHAAPKTLERIRNAEAVLSRAALGGSRRANRDLVRAQIDRCVLQYLMEGPRAAKATLFDAVERLDEVKADLLVRSDALVYLGNALTASKATIGRGSEMLRQARDLACAGGLRSRALIASIFLTHNDVLAGDRAAPSRARECIGIADIIGTPGLISIACMNAAELIMLSSRTARAAAEAEPLLVRATRLIEPHSALWALVQQLQASTSLIRGNTKRALRKAGLADSAAARFESWRMRASTLRILAEIHAQLGHLSRATEFAYEAVDLSERSGNWGVLEASLQAAARITGEKRFVSRALELNYSKRRSDVAT